MNNNERFDRIKAKHHDWSDEQIWTAVSLDIQQDAVIYEKGNDIDPNDPTIWNTIITKAKDWLQEYLPIVYEKVAEIFAGLLDYIKELIIAAIPVIIDKVWEWLSDSFDAAMDN